MAEPLAIVLFAHGSRDAQWREPIEAVAARVAARSPGVFVRCAYLELTEPDLPGAVRQAIAAGAGRIRVVPLLLGVGRHAREDLPRLLAELRAANPSIHFELRPPVGEDSRLLDTLADIALHNDRLP